MLQTGRERGQRDGKPSSVRMMLGSQRCTQTICANLKRKDFCLTRFSASKNGDDDGDEKSSSTSGFLTTLLRSSSGFCSLASKSGKKKRSKRCPCRVFHCQASELGQGHWSANGLDVLWYGGQGVLEASFDLKLNPHLQTECIWLSVR